MNLPDEIWTEIINFLSISEIYSFKFLCKRFFKVVNFHKKIKHFSVISHKIFDINEYYDNFFMFQDLLTIFLKKFDELTFLHLRYCFDPLKNLFMVSALFHLFSCPRSEYVKDNCFSCSRLYVEPLIRPLNFDHIQKFISIDEFSDDIKIFYKKKSYSKIRFQVFFDSIEQFNAVKSDQARCLTTFVVTNVCQIINLFFKTQIRIFYNSFHNIVDDFFIEPKNKVFFS